MKKELQEYVTEKTNDLIQAPSCCPEAKAAAQAWLNARGTDKEAEETAKYIAELEEDIMPIDQLIEFAMSETGEKVFGEQAEEMLTHAQRIKAEGARYCDCPACQACEAILAKKDELLD